MQHEDRWLTNVQKAQQGDSAELLLLLGEFENLIHAAARRFHVPVDERGDLLQESYLAFIKAVNTFDPARRVTFPAYSKNKMHQAVWQYIRVKNRTHSRELSDNPVTDGDGDASSLLSVLPAPDAEAAFCEAEWRSLLVSLSEREALAVEKIVIDGLSMADLARLEGVSPGTVKTWKQRAIVKIRDELKKTQC